MSRLISTFAVAGVLISADGLVTGGTIPEWETVFPQHVNREYLGTRPRTRYSHTMTLVGSELVTAFGYFYDHDDGEGASWEADVWAISAKPDEHASWRMIANRKEADRSGKPHPQPRMNHIAVAPENGKDAHRLVVFGGTDVDHKMLNDLWELDVQTGSWLAHVASAPLPPPRNCFAAAVLEGLLFIYGGFHLGDLWRYNFERRRWKLMIDMPKEDSPNHPGIRSSHAAVAGPDGKDMYVYGGFRFDSDVSDAKRFAHGKLDDLWIYKYGENKWELVPQVNSQGGREFFTMTLASWRLAGTEHMGLVTFGGVRCDPDCSLRGSVAFFSLRGKNWHNIRVVSEPLTRYQHAMVLFNDALWIFGGESYDPHMYHNSVQRLRWPPEGSEALGEEL